MLIERESIPQEEEPNELLNTKGSALKSYEEHKYRAGCTFIIIYKCVSACMYVCYIKRIEEKDAKILIKREGWNTR